jgi:hypothetical protein
MTWPTSVTSRWNGNARSLDNDVVPALVRHDGRAIPVRIRLKGDLVDHLEGDKWSFRIIARQDSTILGMKQFSVQNPQTRDFLNERVYHEIMRREGIIALRYEFVDVTVNGRDLGIYALEESFETRLIENNERKNVRSSGSMRMCSGENWPGRCRCRPSSGAPSRGQAAINRATSTRFRPAPG